MTDNNVIVFKDNELELEVNVAPEEDTVWLTQAQMAQLFQTTAQNITIHLKNIYNDNELDEAATCKDFLQVRQEGRRTVRRKQKYYNLDMIISVGYRVNSKRGIRFRKWATNILKQYVMDGVAVNEKKLAALNKTIDIQSHIIASINSIESDEVLRVVQEYSRSLELLDAYDHQCVVVPDGNECIYKLREAECVSFIRRMDFSRTSDIFGQEKEAGKLQGILAAVYQSVFGKDAYPTLEEKAAHLLYFLIKDHPFNDGCKRIAAGLFLYFLDKNKLLYKNNKKIISDSALVAITLMIAESRPEEKEIMIQVVINFLHW